MFPKKDTAGEAKFPNAGYCTVMKADHHGSDSSNDVFLLGTIQPLVFLSSSGLRPKPHGHPTQQVISRTSSAAADEWPLRPKGNLEYVENPIKGLYVTEIAQKWAVGTTTNKPTQKTRKVTMEDARIVGDIVVRPIDETVDDVQKAMTSGTELTVQVYGTGDQYDLVEFKKRVPKKIAGFYALFPVTTDAADPDPGTPAKGYYYRGPWEHSDTH
jgi:hypothetical protein